MSNKESHDPSSTREAVLELKRFIDFTNEFRSIERTILLTGTESCERNGEHSFQIALVGWYVNQRHKLGLRDMLIIAYAIVHDLVEWHAGDTPLFPDPAKSIVKQLSHADKEEREKRATVLIEQEWGQRFPGMVSHIKDYAKQVDEESRFVKALEKLVAAMNIWSDNGQSWQWLEIGCEEYHALKLSKIRKIDGHPIVEELYKDMATVLAATPELFFNSKETGAQ